MLDNGGSNRHCPARLALNMVAKVNVSTVGDETLHSRKKDVEEGSGKWFFVDRVYRMDKIGTGDTVLSLELSNEWPRTIWVVIWRRMGVVQRPMSVLRGEQVSLGCRRECWKCKENAVFM